MVSFMTLRNRLHGSLKVGHSTPDFVIYSCMNTYLDCLDILHRSASIHDINKAELSQPATTAIQIALVNLLMSWKIKPVVTVGHSSGIS